MARQAIVIIHGIGEQKPMATLRGFVDTLVKFEAARQIKEGVVETFEKNYWSKPDQLSESYELRRLVLAGKGERPTTDFFEYYWAFNMRGTKMGHIVPWFKTLLLKWPTQVPRRLLIVWLLSWVLTIGALVGVLLFFYNGEDNPLGDGFPGKVISFAGTAILIWLQKILASSIGDAARYLTPDPANITERQNIRKNGIDLLRKLQEPGPDGKKYDRIVIVGHSLGSVIAYDVITHLWAACNQTYAEDKIVDKKVFDALKEAADNLEEAIRAKKDLSEIDQLRSLFVDKQRGLALALRQAGNPWLITDFVTMGSPLSHGAFLLSRNKNDFDERKEDRELLTCPPVPEKDKYYYYDTGDKRYYLHHAAAFAPTVWTNIYFPGDLIAGPVSNAFGFGITDIKVVYKGGINRIWSYISPLSHIAYWRDQAELHKMHKYKTRDAIEILYNAVDLNRMKFKSEQEQ